MPMHLLSIDDLTNEDIDGILTRAAELEAGARCKSDQHRIVGLMFGQTSLRTRVGFAAATARLGWQSIEVFGRRHDPTSMTESWPDTLRTLSGYLDILVARPGDHLDRAMLRRSLSIPYISGGSVPPHSEHPTQALIDLFAIESELGPIEELRVAICGDMRMRATRSLLKLIARKRPRRLVLVTVRELHSPLPDPLGDLAEYRPLTELGGVDVLYVTGIPHRAIREDLRDTLRVTTRVLGALAPETLVLSPLPMIDEIAEDARKDRRIGMFAQSDRGLFVRMALIEQLTP